MSLKVVCPVSGEVVFGKKIPDETFSKNMMGETVGIIPSDKKVVSPIDGKIVLCEGHAFAVEAKDGMQILVHMGIDTVKIANDKKAKIFKYAKKIKSMVKAGELVVTTDFAAIKKLGYSTVTPVVVLGETLKKGSVEITALGKTKAGDELLVIE